MSVVAAGGFRASGLAAGIKPTGAPDMTLIAADRPVAAAGVFTTSRTAAPPVQVSRRHLAGGTAQAIVVNSGAANAGTGAGGLADALAMAEETARLLGCEVDEVLVCSTGPIGGRLPMDRVLAGIPRLVADLGTEESHAAAAASGILTTDSVTKSATDGGDGWTVGGIAKGAGMVRPDMATMLAFLTTDAVAPAAVLDAVLRPAVDATFNALNIDGCQSTNDTVFLLASGASGVEADPLELAASVESVCRSLARQMAEDAEGASKVVTIVVSGAADDRAARTLGRAIADSALVRSSFYGGDPNWGRVLAALGVAGEEVDVDRVGITYAGVPVCRGGVLAPFDEESVAGLLAGDFTLEVCVGSGGGRSRVLTTDLTPDYVVFNGERS
jgi:glutamate N-acetyltransferase / amino-acid N-acetyltransferase